VAKLINQIRRFAVQEAWKTYQKQQKKIGKILKQSEPQARINTRKKNMR
jgi:hypothetical protein